MTQSVIITSSRPSERALRDGAMLVAAPSDLSSVCTIAHGRDLGGVADVDDVEIVVTPIGATVRGIRRDRSLAHVCRRFR